MLTREQLQEVVSARKPGNEPPHHRLHAVIRVTDPLRSPPDEPPTANARRPDDDPSHGHGGSSDRPSVKTSARSQRGITSTSDATGGMMPAAD